jgi:hypothetical protein
MKNKLTIFLLAIFLVPILSFANEPEADDVKKKINIEWTSYKYDFGDIEQFVPAIHTFEFVNKGENPVVIKQAKASCGCTVPKFSKEPVRPGEKGTVEVKYDSKKLNKFSKNVTVYIDGADKPFTLFITGNVVAAKPTD